MKPSTYLPLQIDKSDSLLPLPQECWMVQLNLSEWFVCIGLRDRGQGTAEDIFMPRPSPKQWGANIFSSVHLFVWLLVCVSICKLQPCLQLLICWSLLGGVSIYLWFAHFFGLALSHVITVNNDCVTLTLTLWFHLTPLRAYCFTNTFFSCLREGSLTQVVTSYSHHNYSFT